MQNAIGIDVKRDLNLWCATRSGRNPFQVEFAQHLVANRNFAFTLKYLDRDGRLIVVGGRKSLCKLGRDGGVLGDHLGHDTAQRFDAQRQGCHVEQQHVFAVARENLTLNRGTDGNRFIRIHVLARLLAEQFLDLLLYLGHARHAADQDHVVDVSYVDASILDGRAAWADGAFNQFLYQRLQFGTRQLDVQVLWTRSIGCDVGQVDVGLRAAGELDLGFFGRFLEALQCQHVLAQINALILLEFGDDEINDALVKVLATQEGVAVG